MEFITKIIVGRQVRGVCLFFTVAELYSKIVPSTSKLLVRKGRVTLKLSKLHPEDWLQLQPENKPIRPNPKSDDPSAGLMDLMRDMYQSGDDNMKKVIAEAFVREADGVEV